MPVRLFCEEYLNRIPRKPYCTDSLETGLRIRPRDKALQKLYLQLNSPGSCWVLLFDMDQGIPWDVLRTREIPEFTWTVTDLDNFHKLGGGGVLSALSLTFLHRGRGPLLLTLSVRWYVTSRLATEGGSRGDGGWVAWRRRGWVAWRRRGWVAWRRRGWCQIDREAVSN